MNTVKNEIDNIKTNFFYSANHNPCSRMRECNVLHNSAICRCYINAMIL